MQPRVAGVGNRAGRHVTAAGTTFITQNVRNSNIAKKKAALKAETKRQLRIWQEPLAHLAPSDPGYQLELKRQRELAKLSPEQRKQVEKADRRTWKEIQRGETVFHPIQGSARQGLVAKKDYPWVIKEKWRIDDDGHIIRDARPEECTGTLDQHGNPVIYLCNEVLARNGRDPVVQYGLPARHARNVSYDDLGSFLAEKLKEAKDGAEHDLLCYDPEEGILEIGPSPVGSCDGTLRYTRAFAAEHHLDWDRLVARLAGWSFRKEIRCDCDWFLNIQTRGVAPTERTIFHEILPTPAMVAERNGWYCRTVDGERVQCQKGEPGAALDLERVYALFDGEEDCGCDGGDTCDIPVA
jgi:hypothetical protein